MSGDSLLERVDRIESRQTITTLIHHYALGLDLRDAGLFRAIWFDDSKLDMGDFFGRAQGLDDIMAAAARIWSGTVSMHHWMANIVVDIDGDRATARSSLDCLVTDVNAGPTQIGGLYDDVLERRHGRWGIVARTFSLAFWTPLNEWTPREGTEATPPPPVAVP